METLGWVEAVVVVLTPPPPRAEEPWGWSQWLWPTLAFWALNAALVLGAVVRLFVCGEPVTRPHSEPSVLFWRHRRQADLDLDRVSPAGCPHPCRTSPAPPTAPHADLLSAPPPPWGRRGTSPRAPSTYGRRWGPWGGRCPPPTGTWPAACSGPCSATSSSASGWVAGWPPAPGGCAPTPRPPPTSARAPATPPWPTTACTSSTSPVRPRAPWGWGGDGTPAPRVPTLSAPVPVPAGKQAGGHLLAINLALSAVNLAECAGDAISVAALAEVYVAAALRVKASLHRCFHFLAVSAGQPPPPRGWGGRGRSPVCPLGPSFGSPPP